MRSFPQSEPKPQLWYPYAYDELPQEYFRLFRLEKSGSNGLDLQLDSYQLSSSAPKYIALSYTWEPRFPLHTVRINGQGELNIGHNIWKALQTLLPHKNTLIWVDEICINQGAIDERNHQVKVMYLIYNFAKRVLIWLGDSTRGSDTAMQFISSLTPMAISDGLTSGCPPVELRSEVKFPAHFSRLALNSPIYSVDSSSDQLITRGRCNDFRINQYWLIKSLTKLFHRPYWSRVWVIQEIMFAMKPFVRCGDWTVSWNQLNQFHKWANNARLNEKVPHCLRSRQTLFSSAAENIVNMKSAWGTGHHWRYIRRELMDVIDECCNFECTIKHDKIYGLLGLVDENCELQVDYQLTPVQLYRKVINAIGWEPLLQTDFARELWDVLDCGESGLKYFDVLRSIEGIGYFWLIYTSGQESYTHRPRDDIFELLTQSEELRKHEFGNYKTRGRKRRGKGKRKRFKSIPIPPR